jgi:hypothetical protein
MPGCCAAPPETCPHVAYSYCAELALDMQTPCLNIA